MEEIEESPQSKDASKWKNIALTENQDDEEVGHDPSYATRRKEMILQLTINCDEHFPSHDFDDAAAAVGVSENLLNETSFDQILGSKCRNDGEVPSHFQSSAVALTENQDDEEVGLDPSYAARRKKMILHLTSTCDGKFPSHDFDDTAAVGVSDNLLNETSYDKILGSKCRNDGEVPSHFQSLAAPTTTVPSPLSCIRSYGTSDILSSITSTGPSRGGRSEGTAATNAARRTSTITMDSITTHLPFVTARPVEEQEDMARQRSNRLAKEIKQWKKRQENIIQDAIVVILLALAVFVPLFFSAQQFNSTLLKGGVNNQPTNVDFRGMCSEEWDTLASSLAFNSASNGLEQIKNTGNCEKCLLTVFNAAPLEPLALSDTTETTSTDVAPSNESILCEILNTGFCSVLQSRCSDECIWQASDDQNNFAETKNSTIDLAKCVISTATSACTLSCSYE